MTKTMHFSALAAIALTIGLVACGDSDKGDDGGRKVQKQEDDGVRVVYVAGATADAQGKYTATLWENGSPQKLSQRHSEAFSVSASGNDVYVAGYELNTDGSYRPVLWKNGAAQYLPCEDTSGAGAQALSVHVSDGKVYVAGYEGGLQRGNDFVVYKAPKVWVDGQGSRLPGDYGEAVSVFASDGDVYAAGFDAGLGSMSVLWTNQVPQVLAPTVPASSDGLSIGYAESVFVSSGAVYVAGSEGISEGMDASIHAVLWKDGVARRVGGQEESEAYSVFVSGDDVYVAGAVWDAHRSRLLPTVWQNDTAQHLSSASDAFAYSLFVSPNGDVYAAGGETDWQGGFRPMLWKNGEVQTLGGEALGSWASSVFVVEKAE